MGAVLTAGLNGEEKVDRVQDSAAAEGCALASINNPISPVCFLLSLGFQV